MTTFGRKKVLIVVHEQNERGGDQTSRGTWKQEKSERYDGRDELTLPIGEKVKVEKVPQTTPFGHNSKTHEINVNGASDDLTQVTTLAQPMQIVIEMLKVLLKQVAYEKNEETTGPRYETARFGLIN